MVVEKKVYWYVSNNCFIFNFEFGRSYNWLALKPSDDDVIVFCDEVISELKKQP